MKFAPYDQIAGKYYDAFHKTCRNFDQTAFKALTSVRSLIPQSGLILDIGSGKGRCVEFLGVAANRVIQLDNSRVMLDLSPREECLIRIQHNAEQLPFLDEEVGPSTRLTWRLDLRGKCQADMIILSS